MYNRKYEEIEYEIKIGIFKWTTKQKSIFWTALCLMYLWAAFIYIGGTCALYDWAVLSREPNMTGWIILLIFLNTIISDIFKSKS